MKNKIHLLFLMFLTATVGCVTAPEERSTITPATTPTQQIIIPVLMTRWEMVGNPSFSRSGFTLDINGFYLINQRIIIFYSLSGSKFNQLASDNIFHTIDDTSSVSKLTKVIPLSKVDQVEVGLMLFEPRRIGVHELYLVMTAKFDPNVVQKTTLAQLNGSVSDDFLEREFWGAPLKSSELTGYQISITGGIPRENQSDGANSGTQAATSTPILGIYPIATIVVIKSSIPLPPGVIVMNEISFKVENVGNTQVQYQGVQLLSDGSAISVSNGISAWPTPIVLVTPMPPNLSYPPPISYP